MTPAEGTTFVVTDVELDGPSPLRNSMLSFASVAIDGRGAVLDQFEAVLTPRAGHGPDERTTAWWATHPEAHAEATRDPEAPETVMPRYVAWLESLPVPRVFAARPLMLDGVWIDHYLDVFAGKRIMTMPGAGTPLFSGVGLDIASFAAAVTGLDQVTMMGKPFDAEWLGNVPHTHRAIDDALGYANVLARLLDMAAARKTESAMS